MTKLKDGEGTLTVTGEGQMKARPDVAWIRLGVVTEAKTAAEAAQANADLASHVIEKLKALGLPDNAITTVGLNLYPVVEYREVPEKNRIVGFRVEDTVSVEAPVELAGKVFDDGVSAGANEGSGLSFGVKDEAKIRQKALDAAVKAARTDAETVAKAMGMTLRGARTVEIEQGGTPVPIRAFSRAEAAQTPVMPGDVTVTARVRMVFDYR